MNSSVDNFLHLGKIEEAERLAFDSHERHVARYGPDHDETVKSLELLVQLHEAAGRPERAEEWRRRLPEP